MALDPDRELQRIHSILIRNMDRMDELIRDCQNHAATIEDVPSFYNMLAQLRDVAFTLEQEHRAYQRMLARETKYGSKWVLFVYFWC